LPEEVFVSIGEPAALTSEGYGREGGELFNCMEAITGRVPVTKSIYSPCCRGE
jgi:hypothetical protein